MEMTSASASTTLGGDDLARSTSSRRSWATGNRSARSWASASFREVWTAGGPAGESDVFASHRSGRQQENDEEELRWAAIERLPTYDRLRKGMLQQVLDNGRVVRNEVDVSHLGMQDRKMLMENILKVVEEDNEKFLRRLRDRIDRVGIEIPKIEVRYENLSVEGDAYVGGRALPTIWNAALNSIESILTKLRLVPSKRRKIQILKDVNGVVKPSRMTLLLGPPSSGKTTYLLALAGKLDQNLRKSGRVTYCGHELHEFVPQRTCAYISQYDLHHGELTVRETLDFSGRCLGVGSRHEMMMELSRREKEAGIKPDPEIDAFMKATALSGQAKSLETDYILKILGLDICADIIVGNQMKRGISGGQKKRVTTGEMLVGPAKVLLMDEISTGLDSSTTFQICKFMRQMVHIMDVTMIISLLQPSPETFELFDDIILLSEGQVVYHGPRDHVVGFFEYMGFKCPERKGVADFLQEVTSKKDQEQYWFKKNEPYRYISVAEFIQGFNSFHVGQQLSSDLRVPYDRSRVHPAALVTQKYGISNWELFKACYAREKLLMKRNNFVYIFKTTQGVIMSTICFSVFFRTTMKPGTSDGAGKFFGALFFSLTNMMFNGVAELAMTVGRLPVFYRQRDHLFYPSWAFVLPIYILRIPISFMESAIWLVLTYYTIGYAPAASRFFRQFLAFVAIHQMALGLFRFLAGVGRSQVVANTLGTFVLLLTIVLGGFIVSKNDLEPWMKWGYYLSPMMYGQNALVINEFLDDRWARKVTNIPVPGVDTIGKVFLRNRGFFTEESWYWICIGALFGFSVVFNMLFILALTYLNPLGESKSMVVDDDEKKKKALYAQNRTEGVAMAVSGGTLAAAHSVDNPVRKGMVLPFKPLSLAFNHVNYSVDMPAAMKVQGVDEDRLQLLRDVSGSFRPGILTALMGVSGAGKTTLMDVLAGRKTGGFIEGNITISGYPKNQATFARVAGYCEQNDIHSPRVTVYESLLFSAWLRLSRDIDTKRRKMFVDEVMDLVELNPLSNSIVGLPGLDGLSTEQRKRLTIAVELVANPSIIFMDEPTSGLDARAAAIVMRAVRNTVDTGRTVVCTIHQPSIDIFESFDELLLMKRGGQVIYAGPLGYRSDKLVEYFEAIPGVPKIKEGYNPATWMLDVSSSSMEGRLDVDFAEVYANSSLYQRNQGVIKELSTPPPGSEDLYFPTEYSQPFTVQCKASFWKQFWSYWRNPQYNAIRVSVTLAVGVMFGVVFWNKGQKIEKSQDLFNVFGAMYAAVLFLGASNCQTVQSIVAIERTVFYRERSAGMYSPLPYAFAQVAVEAIYVFFQTVGYCCILFFMMGFKFTVAKYLMFFYFIYMCFVYFTLFGMMVVALTPVPQLGAIMMSFFMSFWNLFSGFLVPRPQMPVWWRWYYWCSPVGWTLNGLVTSQMGDHEGNVTVPLGDSVPIQQFLKNSLGFDHDFLPYIVVAHLGFVVLFFFCFSYGIKCLNFQRR